MSVDEIVAAAYKLKPAQFISLRKKLDRLEEKIWKKELTQTSKRLQRAKLTDEKIDRLVLRGRHEGRS